MQPNDRKDAIEYVVVVALCAAVTGLIEWGLKQLPGFRDDHNTHFHFHNGPEEELEDDE